MMCQSFPDDFQRVVAYHGHICPGLVIGYRLAKAAMAGLGIESLETADLVTIAETDRCTVDAFPIILGCTVGKGKFFINNQGKQAFTVGCRKQNKAVRVVIKAEAFKYTPKDDALTRKVMSGLANNEEYVVFKAAREKRIQELLTIKDEDMLVVQTVEMDFPEKEMIFKSPVCQICGEQVMEPWVRVRDDKVTCLACSHKIGN